MDQDIARLRPANAVTRRPDQTLVMPKPAGEHLIRCKTKRDTLKELERLTKRGYVHSSSPLAEFHARAGGGFGVKVLLTKPLPEPMPGWAKGCALVGSVLAGLSLILVLVLNALASMFRAAAVVPWGIMAGCAVAVIALLLVVKRLVFGGGISIIQSVNIR